MRSISAFATACAGPYLRQQTSFVSRAVSSKVAMAGTAIRSATLHRNITSVRVHPRMDSDYDNDSDDNVGRSDEAPPQATEEAKLFVGNLSWDTTDHSLGDAFSHYGTVVEARVVTDRFTGKSRGFGFIEYESANSADDALEGMNGYEVDGRKIRVDRANKRAPRPRREQY